MDPKGRLVLVPLTVQICETNEKKKKILCTFLTLPGKPCLISSLVWISEIQDPRYNLLIVYTHFLCLRSPRKKKKIILRPPTVHDPVIPLTCDVLVDLTILVLSEIQNYFSKVIQQSWVSDDDCFKAWHPPNQLIPVLWSDIQQWHLVFNSLLLSHFISLAHFFSQLRGKGIIHPILLTSCICG